MPTYTFTRKYKVEAKTEPEAHEKCRTTPSKYLIFQSTVTEESEVTVQKPWIAVARQQVIGKRGNA